MNSDFEKIHNRFISQYGAVEGKELYKKFISKHSYDDSKPFPGKKGERKEFLCRVKGVEFKETEKDFHVTGLIATSHIDSLYLTDGISDMIPKSTLESFASQINSSHDARVCGIHHSEGKTGEYFGEADVSNTPASVIELSDGQWGLYVDTAFPKDGEKTLDIAKDFAEGKLNSFSITYDTNGFMTTDFDWVGDDLVRILNPDTRLYGYTLASNPVNPNATAMGYGFKEFKELVVREELKLEGTKMVDETKTPEVKEAVVPQPSEAKVEAPVEQKEIQPSSEPAKVAVEDDSEKKEFQQWKEEKKAREEKELIVKTAMEAVSKMETKEKVLIAQNSPETKELSYEFKEFKDAVVTPGKVEIKEQFRRAAAFAETKNIAWDSTTSKAENREFKNFGTNGTKLEFKALGLTTNQNSDTDYLQASAELQDVYDPVIYNALNQKTLTWNLLAKDNFAGKGNNQVQFTLKTAANATAAFYSNNAVSTGNVTRFKYQTKFKKLQVGVSVDGDMIAAARGGPVSDVFANEVMDSTLDMLAVLNVALFAEKGAETDSECLGFEYVADSAGNATLYNVTRSSANKLAPTSAGDTYINGSSLLVSMTNLRAAYTQAVKEGADKRKLVFITHPTQGNLLRGKFDGARQLLTSQSTDFGFSTDLFVDGVPVFEDKDCNTDDWWLVDLETHRVAIWVPPTIERLGKTADSEEAFIKMYFATYNRAPRRMVQIYGNATS